jgi:hypothetical protein
MNSSTSSSVESKRAFLELLLAERAKRRSGITSRFAPYQADPTGFVEKELLGFLWSKQKEIANSVLTHRRTAVQSCHGSGKTGLAGRIGAWWLSVWPPGEAFLVTLAPTGPQVKGQLWREIKRVHEAGGLPGRTNQTEWLFGDELVGFGRSPRDTDPTAIQGTHARRVLVILDEACGIAKALCDAADTLIANDDCRILAIGNPDDPNTEFASMCKPGSGWNLFTISAYDTPNFTDEPIPDWLRPLLIGKTWVEEKRKSWGDASPLWKSKILGQFPEESKDGLIPLTALREAMSRDLATGLPIELGVDVARHGDDSTVIRARWGDRTKRLRKERDRDLMHSVGVVVQCIRETGATVVRVDDIGLGGGVTDRLKELRNDGKIAAEIIGVNVSESPTDDKADERFKNLRAELNWGMRERFTQGRISLLDDEGAEDVVAQGGQMKYRVTSSGQIQLEEKAEMKKRTGISPDDWDALVLTFGSPTLRGAQLWGALAG